MFCERITSKNGFMTENEHVESGSKDVKVDQKASGDGRPRIKCMHAIFIPRNE